MICFCAFQPPIAEALRKRKERCVCFKNCTSSPFAGVTPYFLLNSSSASSVRSPIAPLLPRRSFSCAFLTALSLLDCLCLLPVSRKYSAISSGVGSLPNIFSQKPISHTPCETKTPPLIQVWQDNKLVATYHFEERNVKTHLAIWSNDHMAISTCLSFL